MPLPRRKLLKTSAQKAGVGLNTAMKSLCYSLKFMFAKCPLLCRRNCAEPLCRCKTNLFSPDTALSPTGHRSFNIDPKGARKHGCFGKSNVTQSKLNLKLLPFVPPSPAAPLSQPAGTEKPWSSRRGSKSLIKN